MDIECLAWIDYEGYGYRVKGTDIGYVPEVKGKVHGHWVKGTDIEYRVGI